MTYVDYYTENENILDSGILADGFFDSDEIYSKVELFNNTGKLNVYIRLLDTFELESDAINRVNEIIKIQV